MSKLKTYLKAYKAYVIAYFYPSERAHAIVADLKAASQDVGYVDYGVLSIITTAILRKNIKRR